MARIITKRQTTLSGGMDAYCYCSTCIIPKPGTPLPKMHEVAVDGRPVQTVAYTPIFVCPECAARFHGTDDVHALADAVLDADHRLRAMTREYLAERRDGRGCPDLTDTCAAAWRARIEGV